MIESSKEAWVTFINNAENRQMQAQMNSTYKQTDKAQEYFLISNQEWEEKMAQLQDQIIQNVIDHFQITKKIEKIEQKTEKKPLTHDDILNEVSAMFFYKDKPEKISEMEKIWKENKDEFSIMDRKLVENSIKVAKRGYIKSIKEKIMHIESKEELEQIQNEIYINIIPEEEKYIIEALINQVKINLPNQTVNLENKI